MDNDAKTAFLTFFEARSKNLVLVLAICQSCHGVPKTQEAITETTNSCKSMEQKKDGTAQKVVMEIRPKIFNSMEEKSAVYKISNNSSKDLNYGSGYRIERLENNKWHNIPLTIGVEDVLYSVDQGKTAEHLLLISFAMGGGHEYKGLYRVCKDVWEVGKENEKIRLDAGFIIE